MSKLVGAVPEFLLEIPGGLFHLPRQPNLMAEIVVDNPLAPKKVQGIDVIVPCSGADGVGVRRGGIKRNPAVIRKIHFHPAMRIASTDHKILADTVIRTHLKA